MYFREEVVIPRDKPYIILEGDPHGLTTIEYGDAGNVVESPTFKLQADNFMARYITFKVNWLSTYMLTAPQYVLIHYFSYCT